ncbi:hypothetical protein H5410_052996 [Solanum commersonii]|uniref:Uncharacterized protein n=1 Tax=Solanum commersonii TaxID=4109 RepID=A0A9J5X2B7_SOLCO|nr:hypothetical protein H5410_052996 [Solanum commersonii]
MTSVKTLEMEPVGPDGQNDPFSRSNKSRSLKAPHFAHFHLALTAKTSHFKDQTNPEEGKPTILPIFLRYSSPYILVIQNFDVIFAEIFNGRPLRP